ncbi:MAG: hypothetical protein OHK0039_03620 [Bacteroidia bacterium]
MLQSGFEQRLVAGPHRHQMQALPSGQRPYDRRALRTIVPDRYPMQQGARVASEQVVICR